MPLSSNAPGASFIGMHVAYVKRMRLYHREGHSWVLETATARMCLMSQRANGRLMHATAPHAACYFYLSKGNPRSYPIKSCPYTYLRQRLSLEVTDFEAHHHHHQSLNREGRWGTTTDFATSFLHFSLFSTALRDLVTSGLSIP